MKIPKCYICTTRYVIYSIKKNTYEAIKNKYCYNKHECKLTAFILHSSNLHKNWAIMVTFHEEIAIWGTWCTCISIITIWWCCWRAMVLFDSCSLVSSRHMKGSSQATYHRSHSVQGYVHTKHRLQPAKLCTTNLTSFFLSLQSAFILRTRPGMAWHGTAIHWWKLHFSVWHNLSVRQCDNVHLCAVPTLTSVRFAVHDLLLGRPCLAWMQPKDCL